MDHLSKAQLATLRAKLEAEAAELNRRLTSDAVELSETPTAEPGDIEDAAAEEAARYRSNQLLARDRARLAEVEAALERIDHGSYGICEDSDEEIPYRRLELEPTTRFTVEAQAQHEGAAGVVDTHGNEPIGY
ncbi:General stress protein 16O [Enhygromyxa salina]|uniref:General stress protein 16O n=1 Tax=Enhygromyxa salina TaxID=215803 RepID=A0A2S9YFK6_9BACT|nr:TraR/DksA family transcriptional regulator [Enhygromyxa salina]PRQ03879.1 General stress protein 16O [Enhygromyxa salina]